MSGCLAGFDLGAEKLCSGLLRCIDASIPPPTAAQRASGYANAVRRHASPPPPVSERTAASVAVRASRSPPGYFCHWLAFFWRIDSGAAAVSPYHFRRRHRRRQPVASSHNYPLSLLSLSSALSHRSHLVVLIDFGWWCSFGSLPTKRGNGSKKLGFSYFF